MFVAKGEMEKEKEKDNAKADGESEGERLRRNQHRRNHTHLTSKAPQIVRCYPSQEAHVLLGVKGTHLRAASKVRPVHLHLPIEAVRKD